MKYLAPVTIVVGILAVILGAMLQAYGAASAVFCSVIGGGIVLVVIGALVWLIRTLRGRTPKPSVT